jgi:hypothetical protein
LGALALVALAALLVGCMCCRKRGPKLASDGQAFKVFTSHDVEGESKVGRLRVVVADEEDRRATAETEEETKTA